MREYRCREFEKHVKFVVKLVTILKVADLTQENVSCLNTSLVSSLTPLSTDPHSFWSAGSGYRRAKLNHRSEEISSFEVLLVVLF